MQSWISSNVHIALRCVLFNESHTKIDGSGQIAQLIPPSLHCCFPFSLGQRGVRIRLLRELRDQQIDDRDVFVSATNSINTCVSMRQASGGVVDMRCECHGERSLVDFELKGIELLPKGLSRHLPQAQERLRIQHQWSLSTKGKCERSICAPNASKWIHAIWKPCVVIVRHTAMYSKTRVWVYCRMPDHGNTMVF